MKLKEYGIDHQDVIVLLHGGGLSWWNYREEAEKLHERYHVIIPILDGHSGSGTRFTSIENNAEKIIRLIDERFGGRVLLMGGLSLGGQILLEILVKRYDICRYAVIESAGTIPSKLTHTLIRPLLESSYGLIKRRWFSKMQFNALHIMPSLFEDYYRDTRNIKKEDMIAFLRASTSYSLKASIGKCSANVHIFIGEKEDKNIKQSALQIQKMISSASVHILPGLYHGEFSLNDADGYVKAVEAIINDSKSYFF